MEQLTNVVMRYVFFLILQEVMGDSIESVTAEFVLSLELLIEIELHTPRNGDLLNFERRCDE